MESPSGVTHRASDARYQDPIVILGAGCAGLAAAMRLTQRGYPVLLIEQADHVGGLAGGVRLNGNTYEYGPHTFHSPDPELAGEIHALMGDALIPYNRTIKVKFLGHYFKFPLSVRDVLLKLPPQTVVRAGLSFLYHVVVDSIRRPRVETSETLLRRYYGDVLYDLFFKTYITSVWGISPAQFSPAFSRERIPRLNFLDLLEKLQAPLKKNRAKFVNTQGYVEKVEGSLYTTREGFSLITQRMADQVEQQGGRIELNATVTRIARAGRCARSITFTRDGQSHAIPCRAVINTLPITRAIQMTEPPFEPALVESARALQFRALVFVGLLVRKDKVLPSSFMYFRQHSFNRISDLAQFGFHITPENHTLLVAEISCGVNDRAWTDDDFARSAVLNDLIAEHLLTRDDVIEMHVFRAEHAYPIYALGYEKHLDTILQVIDSMENVETAGRQGRFQYVNTHVAMKMGHEAAARLVEKMQAQVLSA